MKQSKIQTKTIELIDYARFVMVAMFLIVIVYMVANAIVGQVPATIGSIVFGLVGVFIIATNKKVRQEILNWGK